MAAAPPPEPRSLPSPPTDGITALSYLPPSSSRDVGSASKLLVSTSWDGSVRIHDTSADNPMLVTQKSMDCGPLLCLAVARKEPSSGESSISSSKSTGAIIYTGGLDGSIRRFDVDTNEVSVVGYHGGPTVSAEGGGSDKHAVSCLCTVSAARIGGNVLASASWDGTFHLWDLRGVAIQQPSSTLKLPGKAFGMDVTSSNLGGTELVGRIVVATSGRRTCIIDIETDGPDDGGVATAPAPLSAVMRLERESSLKYQTRVVKFFADGTGLALGSIEGRVAIEYLDELQLDSGGKKKYAFKCHRVGDTVYPVNSIAFHPILGTFATGGCDGTVVTWDGRNKKKLTTLPKFPTSVAAMTFNGDGTELAIASSYTFEEGEREHPRDEIYVREMLDYEVKPKSK